MPKEITIKIPLTFAIEAAKFLSRIKKMFDKALREAGE